MILDTTALSAMFRGDKGLAGLLETTSQLHLPVIVLGEYRFGLLNSRLRRSIEPLLKMLESESVILPVDHDTVRPYAEVRDRLRRAGKPLPQNDTWIAALALQHELPIASLDKHFDAVAGVRRVSW